MAGQSGRFTSSGGETSGRNARMWRGTLSAQPNTSLHCGSIAGGAAPRRYAPARNFLMKPSTCREEPAPPKSQVRCLSILRHLHRHCAAAQQPLGVLIVAKCATRRRERGE